MEPLTVSALICVPPLPRVPCRSVPTGQCFFAGSSGPQWIPPFKVRAETSALASGGSVTETLPLTVLREARLTASRLLNAARTEPLTLPKSTSAVRPSTVSLPLTVEALTRPWTPWISTRPLTLLISSNTAWLGTLISYSTVVELFRFHRLHLVLGYLV